MKTFDVVCKENGSVIACATWEDSEENRKRLEDWAEFGYEKTSEKYVQGYDGKWYVEGTLPPKPLPTNEEIRQIRASSYRDSVDPLMSEYIRKKTFNLFAEDEEKVLLSAIENQVNRIKSENPYS
ncbi:MAG: hypothetical protein E7019_06265 [Alphaproteobacteria bacterium]|nr:hypothetical protein [Alphaproteobacteria bacterium]